MMIYSGILDSSFMRDVLTFLMVSTQSVIFLQLFNKIRLI